MNRADGRTMLSEEDARVSASEFLASIGRDAGFHRERLGALLGSGQLGENPNVGPLWTFDSPFGTVSVSRRTGAVVFYSAPEPDEMGAPRITETEAREIAGTFLKHAQPDFDEKIYELAAGEEEGYFIFEHEQVRQPGEVSIFSNIVSLEVRADTGTVCNYSRSDLDFKRSTPPRIDEEQARSIVEEMVDGGSIDALELVEEPVDEASRSITVWLAQIRYSGKFERVELVFIDADTGKKLDVD